MSKRIDRPAFRKLGAPRPENAVGRCGNGMVKHATKGAARAEMSRLERAGRGVDPERPTKALNVFRCGECGRWHVGFRVAPRSN